MNYDGKLVIGTEIDTKKFDKQLEEVDEKSRKLEQKIKKDKEVRIDTTKAETELENLKNKKIEINPSLGVGQLYSEIVKANSYISDLKNQIEEKKALGIDTSEIETQIKILESFINSANNRVEELGSRKILIGGVDETNKDLEKTNKELKEVSNNVSKSNAKTVNSFEKSAKSLKKFGLSLFSISTIYSTVSKASSAYLSQDTELAQKLQNVWIGLGSAMAPALEWLSDALLKGLGYLNVFVKALTGVDFIANANAKALEKQANAQKKLNKENQQYDFDVIRTQQSNKTDGSSNSSSTSGLIEIPELDSKLVEKLQDLAKWLKENWDLVEGVGTALLITFGAAQVAKYLKGIGNILGNTNGVGLKGLGIALLALADVYLIKLVIDNYSDIFNQIKDLKEAIDDVNEGLDKQHKKDREAADAMWDYIKSADDATQAMLEYSGALTTDIELGREHIKSLKDQWTVTGMFNGANEKLADSINKEVSAMMFSLEEQEKLYKMSGKNKEQTENYMYSLSETIKVMEDLGMECGDLKKEYQNLAQNYNAKFTTTFDAKQTQEFKDILKNINSIAPVIGGTVLGTATALKYNSNSRAFALGGIVTQPTRALIGEAGYPEAVVPMTDDYLGTLASLIAQYGGSGNNSPINIYLDGKLILRQVANKQSKVNFAVNR